MSNANLVTPSTLLPWEEATLPPGTLIPGLIAPHNLRPLTLAVSLGMMLVFMPVIGLWAVLPAFMFGRLVAFDATTYTLPDVYTMPLISAGLAHVFWVVEPERLIPAATLYALYLLARERPLPIGIGGGDYKLLIAMFLWFTPSTACFALALGCLVWLPFTFFAAKKPVPFGIPLLVGWAAMLFVLSHIHGLA